MLTTKIYTSPCLRDIAEFKVSSYRLAMDTGRYQKPALLTTSAGKLVGDELLLIVIYEYHDVERTRRYEVVNCEISDCFNTISLSYVQYTSGNSNLKKT